MTDNLKKLLHKARVVLLRRMFSMQIILPAKGSYQVSNISLTMVRR